MTTISLSEAQSKLVELVHRLVPGESVILSENDRPVARLEAIPLVVPRPRPPVTGIPRAGQYEGRLVVPEDFDEPLEELREYME